MKLLATLVLLVILAASALAEEKPDCEDALRAYIYGPWAIAKGMADYKAAMDAGYDVCSANDPGRFEEAGTTYEFLRENTKQEMEQAAAVLDYLIDHPDPKKVPKECASDNKAREALKKQTHAAVDGQYEKAYERRQKALAMPEPAVKGNDSCALVLEMIEQYGKHYDQYKQLQHVLYESSKKKGRVVLTGSARKNTFRNFEKIRDQLAEKQPEG